MALDIWVGETNITPLLKAFQKFEKFRQHAETEQERAGIVQAFEYCFELTWKMMRRILMTQGIIGNSPREVFRLAGTVGMIKDPEIWFDFIKKRNLTVHTYQEDQADEVIRACPAFSQEIHSFLRAVGVNDDQY